MRSDPRATRLFARIVHWAALKPHVLQFLAVNVGDAANEAVSLAECLGGMGSSGVRRSARCLNGRLLDHTILLEKIVGGRGNHQHDET